MSKSTWEDIDRLSRFCKAYRDKRPNSPIIKGTIDKDGTPLHLTVDDVEALVEAGKKQLPLRDLMRFHESRRYQYDPATSRIEACL